MLKQIVHWSLRFRGVVLAMACVVVAYGIYVAQNAKLDVFPEFVQPQVEIQTESPGLAAEQVEMLVTLPVENAMTGASELESVRSESIQGLSVVTAVFKEGTDIFHARQMLAEKLTGLAGELPAGVKPPKMFPLTSSTMDVLKFGLTSTNLTPMQLRTFADWKVRPLLLAVAGVAKVSVFGGEIRQIQIRLRPERLTAFNVTVDEVMNAARNATGVRGSGFIETPGQRIDIQTEGQSFSAQTIGQTIVSWRDGRSLRLADVSEVVEAGEPKFGDALINGDPGILMTVSGQYGANTMELTELLESALDAMKPVFAEEGVNYVARMHRPASFIEASLQSIRSSLLLGGLFVGIILLLFLLDFRTALISFISIPLSLLTAVVVLTHFGATLNTMTLGGLAVAIGVVVDDAIIDVENILRRLRENSALATPRPILDLILDASLEVRSAVVYATFIVAFVFIPVLMMSGIQGRFFAPLATAFILATMASLAVALTVTPALCMAILTRIKPHGEPRYIIRLKAWHRSLLQFLMRWPRVLIGIVCLFVIAAGVSLQDFGGEFLPEFREGHFVLQVSTLPGTSLPEMVRLGHLISRELLNNPHIKSVEQQIGRAEMGEDTWRPNRTEFHVELKPSEGEDQEKTEQEIRSVLAGYPGIQFNVLTFLGDRISETISGETADVVVNIFCDDMDAADQKAVEIARTLSAVKGSADVQVTSLAGAPRILVRLLPEKLARFGFRPLEVLDAIQLASEGEVAGQIYEGNRVTDVAVILEPDRRKTPQSIGLFPVQNSEGLRMPLSQLAEISLTTSRDVILHEGSRRRQTVTCNTSGRDVASFVEEAKQKVASAVSLPKGAYLVYSGAAEQQARAQRELLLHSAIAAIGIILLLAMLFHSWRSLMLVLANIPFALVGGVLAAFLTGYFGDTGKGSLSLGTLVGFVTLFGISARNSIMMVSHFEHLVTEEGMTWGLEAALRGSTERLVPILMTALVTSLGLLPLALGAGAAGKEIEGPMAIVILGGLLTSTILNLLVLPAVALRYGKFAAQPKN